MIAGSRNRLRYDHAPMVTQQRQHSVAPIFRGAALRAQSITTQGWMLAGPAETGKTFAALWRLDTLLKTTPKSSYALVRKVAADIGPTVLRTYQRVIAMSGSGAVPYGGNSPQWYDYPNGARLWLGGMDRPGKVLSGERDGIYVNQAEELTLEDWETLSTRTTGRGAVTDTPMLFGDCNPGPSTHWIINRSSLEVLYSKHEDNPSLYTDDGVLTAQGIRSMMVLDALTGVRYKRLRLGLWVSAEGTVYDFDRGIHVISRAAFEQRTMRRHIAGVDWGFTNPGVIGVWGIDGDGRMYLVREIYQTQRLIGWWTTQAKDLQQTYQIQAFACDPAEPAFIKEFRNAGLNAIGGYNDITPGIQAVQSRLKVAPDDEPRMYVVEGALAERDEDLAERKRPISTVQEFDVYVWPKGVDGKPMKEKPVDDNNHGMDMTRYSVAHIDGLSGEKSRKLVIHGGAV